MPYVTINDIRMRYESWGAGPPLIMLHGLGSCADDWVYQLPVLGRHFRCLPLDLRGHGLSDKPPGRYSMPLFAGDVAEFIRASGNAPAHVLGLSLGGMVAQQLAIDHPDLVRSLVLINTLPGIWPPTRDMLRTAVCRLRALNSTPDMSDSATLIANALFPDADQHLLHTAAVQRLRENDPDAYRRASSAITRFRPGRRLRSIGCPVLIIAGELDNIVPLAYKERLRRKLPQAGYLVVPGSRHASNLDRPQAVNDAILGFLLSLPTSNNGYTQASERLP